MKLYFPIVMNNGIDRLFENLNFSIPLSLLKDGLVRHKGYIFDFSLSISTTHTKFNEQDISQFGLDHLSERYLKAYLDELSSSKTKFTLVVESLNDLRLMASEYSVPNEVYQDLIFSLGSLFQGLFILFSACRVRPLVLNEQKELFFNYKLAYQENPYQDWFFGFRKVDVLLGGTSKDFSLLLPYLNYWQSPLKIDRLIDFLPKLDYEDIISYARLISSVIRLTPAYDYSLIVSLFTGFIEGMFKINSEHTYKFAIKVSNLLKNPDLYKVLKKIYSSRSNFVHTVNYKRIDTYYDLSVVCFLTFVTNKLILFKMAGGVIDENSFNFPFED